jgi:hypothetical protein
MKSANKAIYESPTVLVVVVKTESHICIISDPNGEGHGFNGWD